VEVQLQAASTVKFGKGSLLGFILSLFVASSRRVMKEKKKKERSYVISFCLQR
jgi:hypothetical protein